MVMSANVRYRHFGVLPFTGTGHLNPLIALAQELVRHGHRVTFFERPRIRERVERAGLEFVPVCSDRPATEKAPEVRRGIRAELAMLRFNLYRVSRDIEQYLRETPAELQRAGINALLVNEIAVTGPTIAEQMRLPYFLLSTSVPHNCGWDVYPWYAGYRYRRSPFSMLERRLLEISAVCVRGPIRMMLDQYRRSAGLGSLSTMQKKYPPLAQITQLPQCLDFPGARLPENCYYSGPWIDADGRPEVDFPWEKLDGRPIAYVSLGTTRNVQARILRLIAEACDRLEVQVVISLGGRFTPEAFADLSGNPLVVSFAPQMELLRRSRVVITHGGPNTVFESLMEGKPLVAIPLAYDQPAVSARAAAAGAARVLPVMRLSALGIRDVVTAVLEDSACREAAMALRTQIRAARGAERAVEIIEDRLLRT